MAIVKLPTINLSEIVIILKTEGGAEIGMAARTLFKDTNIFNSWDRIIRILEFNVLPILAKGDDVSKIKPYIPLLLKESKVLTDSFTAVGSFIPGPIGIVCSLIRAIVCFCEGNIPMGILELLGCIPGAKAGIKGGSKIAEKIGSRMMVALKKNKDITKYCAQVQLLLGKVCDFHSSFVISRLDEIKKFANQTMQTPMPKFLELTRRDVKNREVTKFGSLLIKNKYR